MWLKLLSVFESMSLARRLSLGFVGVLALLLAVAITSSYALKLQGERVKRIVQVNNIKVALANDLMESINDLAIRSRSAALFTEMDHRQLQLEYLAAKAAQDSFTKTEQNLAAMLEGEDGALSERKLMGDVFAAKQALFALTEESLIQALDADNVAATLTLSQRVRPAEMVLRANVTALIDLQKKISEAASADVLALQQRVFVAIGILVVVALVMGGMIAWRITRSVTTPINRMQALMTEIASSQDFSRRVPVDRMDEIGCSLVAFNSMIEKIQEGSLLLRQKTLDMEVMNRDLSTSYEQLKIAKDELVRREKLAALGSLVAGIAHELNTPIGNGLMAVSTLREELTTLQADMAVRALPRKTFEDFLLTIGTASEIASRSLTRSADLVRNFKQLSLDQATDNRRTFSVQEQLSGTLLMLQPTLKKLP
jgi:methyl-accepting chemotaxis protein